MRSFHSCNAKSDLLEKLTSSDTFSMKQCDIVVAILIALLAPLCNTSLGSNFLAAPIYNECIQV
jgi:hypothetical protein